MRQRTLLPHQSPTTCQPIQPWDFLGVNTIFQVIHNAGMRTAWSDKHAVYTSFNGLREIFAGHQSAQFFGVSYSDPHHPDVFGIAQVGTIYTTGSKIAEHGGDNPGDRDVPLVVYAPGTVQPGQSSTRVETTQVAPTILKLLGLSPNSLQAVQQEGTQVLPGLGNGD
jgi:hypothetical protein